jgi:hypothetical protein
MRKALLVFAMLAAVGGVIQGCTQRAAADEPPLGEYVGTTPSGVTVRRFTDDGSVCYVATHGPYNNSPVAISCR